MTIDDILHRAFRTTDLAAVTPSGLEAGIERLTVDQAVREAEQRRLVKVFTSGSVSEVFLPPEEDMAPLDADIARWDVLVTPSAEGTRLALPSPTQKRPAAHRHLGRRHSHEQRKRS